MRSDQIKVTNEAQGTADLDALSRLTLLSYLRNPFHLLQKEHEVDFLK